jgi:RNA polymerase sigma factor (sigma-70 family)
MDFHDGDSAPSKFRTTAWSVVAHAQNPESRDYNQSLEYLCKTYWKPIYYYMRRRGLNHDTARDLTQDYFATFLEKGFVEAADRTRGKFRTYMLTILTRFLSKQYRKHRREGRRVPLTISIPNEEGEFERSELAVDRTAEDEFNRSWARSLIATTLERMRQDCEDGKKQLYYKVFAAFLDSATDVNPKSYRELADLLGLSEVDITNYLHRGRNIFQKLLREEVRQSVLSEGEVDEEIDALRRYFV